MAGKAIRIDVFHHFSGESPGGDGLSELRERVDETLRLVQDLTSREYLMPADLQPIIDSVENLSDVNEGAISLLTELAQLVRDSATDPASIRALADQIDAKVQDLATAVVINTPADPDAGGGDTPPPDDGGGTTPPDDGGGVDVGPTDGTDDGGAVT